MVRRLAGMIALLVAGVGCAKQRPEKIPGETDVAFRSVSIVAEGKAKLAVSPAPLLSRLGQRAGSALYTDRYYNPFRMAEDRRRIESYWQTLGYFEVQVSEPQLQIDASTQKADVTWTVREGPRYGLARVEVRGVPEPSRGAVEGLVPVRAGGELDLEAMRVARYDMAARMQRDGHGHARMLVRFYLDRKRREVTAVYLADAGPKTRIGTVKVEGSRKVSEGDVLARSGLEAGEPYTLAKKEKAEFDLLDTGAFATAVVESSADVEMYLGDVPDSGGVIGEGQVDAEGNLVGRTLSDTIDVVIHVNEAPSARVRVRGTLEGDPTRIDATAGSELLLPNALGSLHHLTLRGLVGYGWLWRGDTDEPTGLYGEALAQYNRPGALGRLGDVRLGVRYRDTLFPGFHLRELTAGPGVRSTLAAGTFVDVDLVWRRGQAVGFGPFDAAERERLRLPDDDVASGAEAQAAVVVDRRNDPIEPMSGYLLALRGAYAPGGALSTHRYLRVTPEARVLVPLTGSVSVGLRGSGGWVALGGDEGVPLGPRLFGGGAYGMRGFGRDRLSPRATTCAADGRCRQEVTGGLSLLEASLEVRFLPPLKQFGLVGFVDAGGAGARANPLEGGLELAVGVGPRVRLWYVPVSIDLSYHPVHQGKLGEHDVLLFFRIGEAF